MRKSLNYTSQNGPIRLAYNKATGTLIYKQRGGYQSAIDRHGDSLDSYIHALYGLALQTGAKRVLMIGCAGGTLGTMLARWGARVTIVDIDPVAFKLARRHFQLPRAVRCVTGDGVAYMQKTRARFDLVIVDAFIGEDIPAQFKSDDFAKAARRVVRKSGALFVNVCLAGYRDRTADAMAALLKKNKWTTRLIDQRGPNRNAIVLCGNVKRLTKPKVHIVPEHDIYFIKRELKGMRFREISI